MNKDSLPLDRALDIIDPETSQNAMAPFTGDCILTRELMTEARRVIAANDRQVKKSLGLSFMQCFVPQMMIADCIKWLKKEAGKCVIKNEKPLSACRRRQKCPSDCISSPS